MEQTTFKETDLSELVRKFWEKTKGRERTAFLFILQEEGLTRNTIYKYAREHFKKASGITLRGIVDCINDYETKKKRKSQQV